MPIRWLTGMQKLDSGQTVGKCNVCKMEFASNAAFPRTAQDELQSTFDTHVCHSGNKAHKNIYTNRTGGEISDKATGRR
jgi:hypothetical protein